MNYYLIEFRAEYYCQGYEWETFQCLVKANSFEEAVEKLKQTNELGRFDINNHKDFQNLTIE